MQIDNHLNSKLNKLIEINKDQDLQTAKGRIKLKKSIDSLNQKNIKEYQNNLIEDRKKYSYNNLISNDQSIYKNQKISEIINQKNKDSNSKIIKNSKSKNLNLDSKYLEFNPTIIKNQSKTPTNHQKLNKKLENDINLIQDNELIKRNSIDNSILPNINHSSEQNKRQSCNNKISENDEQIKDSIIREKINKFKKINRREKEQQKELLEKLNRDVEEIEFKSNRKQFLGNLIKNKFGSVKINRKKSQNYSIDFFDEEPKKYFNNIMKQQKNHDDI